MEEEIAHIAAFRRLIDEELAEFLAASESFGGPLKAMADKVKDAFNLELQFIISGVNMSRPDDAKLNSMIDPLSNIVNEIQEFRYSNRHVVEFFNHLSTVGESIVALSWITRICPGPFVREMRDAGEYFGNRVLSANRSNDQHISWIKAWQNLFEALEKYVVEFHKAAFDWGAAARLHHAATVLASGAAAAAAPPPPPPPPPASSESASGDTNRSALMSQISAKGQDIVQILRPVRLDPESRARGVESLPLGEPHSLLLPRSPVAPTQHPPKLQLEGRKWRVEYQKENYALVIESADMAESLAVYKCENIGLEVRNKMNGISIDSTKRSTIALNDVISSVELIRCADVKIQCNGVVPLISVEKCESVQIFLTGSAIGVELISSNSTSLNVCILEPDGTYVELPVPEQIRTVIYNGKLHSTALEKM